MRERKRKRGEKSFFRFDSPKLVLGLAVGNLVVAEPDADALKLAREDAENGGGGGLECFGGVAKRGGSEKVK